VPYRGWFNLGEMELANASRVVDHLAVPDDGSSPLCGCNLHVGYDDTWPELKLLMTGSADPYVITEAPWYDAAIPESGEFAGVWVMDVKGLDALPVQRELSENLCAGGVASTHRDAARPITFTALIVACSNAGAEFGLDWLACVLRQATVRGGVPMTFLGSHPSGTAGALDPRMMNSVVLTSSATVMETSGRGGSSRHRQSSVYRVEFTLTAGDPYVYASPTDEIVSWDSTTTEPITWVHAPNCNSPADCDLPVMFSTGCEPPQITVVPAAPVPTCGGCVPVCEVERRVALLDVGKSRCAETAVTVTVRNNGAEPLTVNLHWRQCGTSTFCDEQHHLQIAGLPANSAAVADSVSARPFAYNSGGQRVRQVGVVGTPSGAPWTPLLIDRADCWELVAESAPGSTYSVELTYSDRYPR
jgi:hypothetical protein